MKRIRGNGKCVGITFRDTHIISSFQHNSNITFINVSLQFILILK